MPTLSIDDQRRHDQIVDNSRGAVTTRRTRRQQRQHQLQLNSDAIFANEFSRKMKKAEQVDAPKPKRGFGKAKGK